VRALITRAAWQDGTILATRLDREGASLAGIVKPGTSYSRLKHYAPSIEVVEVDMADVDLLRGVIQDFEPSHIYNFGAFTAPGESWEHETEVLRINVDAVTGMLDATADSAQPARFFQASSSHIFEGTDRSPQDEGFELSPRSPYARSKAAALQAVRSAREERGLFAVSAILYNHESPLRGDNFVTRKVTKAAARIAAGQQAILELGDIDVARDWGWAPDYVHGIRMMLEAPQPRDFVLATGISHRLSFFVQKAFAAAGIRNWTDHVVSSASDRPVDTNKMVGNPRAAYVELGWRHTMDFDSMAAAMVHHDQDLLSDPDALWLDF